jgi:hypothetical protein
MPEARQANGGAARIPEDLPQANRIVASPIPTIIKSSLCNLVHHQSLGDPHAHRIP